MKSMKVGTSWRQSWESPYHRLDLRLVGDHLKEDLRWGRRWRKKRSTSNLRDVEQPYANVKMEEFVTKKMAVATVKVLTLVQNVRMNAHVKLE